MILSFKGPRSVANSLTLFHRNHQIAIDPRDNIPEDITEVVITHTDGLWAQRVTVPVFMNKYANRTLQREHYPFRRKIFWSEPFYISDMKITPVPVKCSIRNPTSGLVIETDTQKAAIFPYIFRMRNLSVLRGSTFYIGDGRALDVTQRRHHESHASIREQLEWCKQQNVGRALFMNLGRWAPDDISTLRQVFRHLSVEFDVKAREALNGYTLTVVDGSSMLLRCPVC